MATYLIIHLCLGVLYTLYRISCIGGSTMKELCENYSYLYFKTYHIYPKNAKRDLYIASIITALFWEVTLFLALIKMWRS